MSTILKVFTGVIVARIFEGTIYTICRNLEQRWGDPAPGLRGRVLGALWWLA